MTDNGVGIEPAALAHVGEPFFRADSAQHGKQGGFGLGLAICRRLLALHGGSLTIESRQGEGTTVRAIFPRDRVIYAVAADGSAAESGAERDGRNVATVRGRP